MWHPRSVELSLETDGPVAAVRVSGSVTLAEAASLSDYLRVARENGAVRGIVDLSACPSLPTTIIPVLIREADRFAEAGGALSLCGVRGQNPFLSQLVTKGRFGHYRSIEEARTVERRLAGDAEGSS